MKIKRISDICFRVRGDGPQSVYIYYTYKFTTVIDRLCDLSLSPEEIGKAVILMTSSTPEEEAKNLEIDYES